MSQVEAGASTFEPSEALSPRAWGLMATLCIAQVLEVLGVTVVIVALPVIGADLGLRDAQLQLVVSLYAVLYGGLLLTAGRVADLLDRRAVFAAGLAVTLVGVVVCATVGTGTTFLVGRAVQGLGGAIVTPAALSPLTSGFPAGRARRVAVSAWTAAAAGGGGGALGTWWAACSSPVRAGGRCSGCWPPWPRECSGRCGGWSQRTPRATASGGSTCRDRSPPPRAWCCWCGCRPGRGPGARPGTAGARGPGRMSAARRVRRRGAARSRAADCLVRAHQPRVHDRQRRGLRQHRHHQRIGHPGGPGRGADPAPGPQGHRPGPVAGLGLSWAAVTSTSSATLALPQSRQGVASGAVNTAAQIGTALGVAVLLALAAAVGVEGRATGYVAAFTAAAALAGAYALLLVLRPADN